MSYVTSENDLTLEMCLQKNPHTYFIKYHEPFQKLEEFNISYHQKCMTVRHVASLL